MAERNLSDADIAALSKAIGKQSTPSSTAPGNGNKAIDTALSETASKLSPFGQNLKEGGEAAVRGLKSVQGAVQEGLDTWRDLSKSGAGFNNDIVGMTVAAAGTRLPLREFAGVIKDNTDILGQLGGSVTRGAESFAKMSKSFFDSGATDSLKQLGYTNKDLNDILALQAVTLRGKFQSDQQRDAVAIENASKLATEMDLMAKLTGKSREAQMEQMKKNQMDMQFEAAIRLKTAGMSAEEAAKFEANARQQLKDAQLRGAGDMFKEVFATGQIQSKEAATQAAVNQEQAAATMRQAQASAIGDQKAADAANREAQRAAVADANNTSKLQMVALGNAGGAAGKALTDSMGAQITYTKSLEATAAANGLDVKNAEDRAKAQKIMEEEAKKAQSGKNEKGEQVDGATKAAVQLGNRLDDARAALTSGLLEPLNKEVGPGLRTFADKYLSGKDFEGSGKRMAPAIEGAMARGNKSAQADGAPDRRTQEEESGIVTGIAKGVGFAEGKVLKGAKAGIDKLNGVPAHAEGGIIQGPELAVIAEQGPEAIIPLDKIGDVMPKAEKGKAGGALGGMPSLDLSSITSDLSASFKDFNISFSSMSEDSAKQISKMSADLADAMPLDALDQNAAALEYATKRRAELEQLMTDGQARSGAEWDEIFDEAEQLDGQIDKLATKQLEAMSNYSDSWDESGDMMDQISNDIAETMGGSKAEQAQAKIDAAIAAKDAAYEKLQKLWNEGSDDELNENHEKYAEELRAAKENLNKVIEESMGDLTSSFDEFGDGWDDSIGKVSDDITNALPVDDMSMFYDQGPAAPVDNEFGDLDGAIAKQQAQSTAEGRMKDLTASTAPTATQSRGITMDSFTIGPNGMPIAKPKSTAAATPDKKSEKSAEDQAKDREAQQKAEAEKSGITGDKAAKGAGSESKAATLDDVVKSLNALNTKMGQLITVSEDGHKSTAKAAKSGSTNLYAR